MKSPFCSHRQSAARALTPPRLPIHRAVVALLGILLCVCVQSSPTWAATRTDIVWMHGNNVLVMNSAVFSPDKTLIATAGGEGTIKLKRTADGVLLHTLLVGTAQSNPIFSPDGTMLLAQATGSLWDVRTGTFLRTLPAGNSTTFSPDSRAIAVLTSSSVPNQSIVKTYKVSDGSPSGVITTNFTVAAVAYTPDGQTLLLGGADSTGGTGVLALYRVSDGTLLRTITGVPTLPIKSITFTPDGSTFATIGNGISLWHTSDFSFYRYQGDTLTATVTFSPDSSLIAWVETASTTVQVAKVGGASVGSFDNGVLPTAFSFSSDGKSIYTVSLQSIKRWDTASLTLRQTFQAEHTSNILSVALSPDGQTIATGSADLTIKLWHKQNGALIRTLIGEEEAVASVAFSPDGQTLISGGFDQNIRVWRVSDGVLLNTIPVGGFVSSVAYSPDGLTLASGDSNSLVKLWRASDGGPIATLTGHSGAVSSVAFSPDSKTLASGSADRTIRLWNVASQSLQRTLAGHLDVVNCVAFSSDGTQLLSGGNDNKVILWTVATGAIVNTFGNHTAPVVTVAFSPDGRTLVSGSEDLHLKLWKRSDQTLLQDYTAELGTGVLSVAYTANSRQLVIGRSDATVMLINIDQPFDFDGDGYNDLLFQSSQTGQMALWYLQGPTLVGGAQPATQPAAGWNVVGSGDFNRDGAPDLVFQNPGTGAVAIWYMNNTTYLGGQPVLISPGPTYKVVGVGDFNGDHKPDLVFEDAVTGKIVIWFMDGATVIGASSFPYIPSGDFRVVGVGDFNGDGQSDLLLQNFSTGQLVVWYMNGANYAGGSAIAAVPGQGWSVKGVGDYNNDGMPDILLQNATTNQVIIWTMNGLSFAGSNPVSKVPFAYYNLVAPR